MTRQEQKVNNQQQELGLWNPTAPIAEKPTKPSDNHENKRVDPFQVLPNEILTDIMLLIPRFDIGVRCVLVSKVWWNKILGFAELWSVLLLNNTMQGNSLTHLAPYLGHCLKDLTILSSSALNAEAKFMEELQKGRYKKLRSLKLLSAGSTMYYFGPTERKEELKTTDIFSSWELKNTLTRRHIDVGENNMDYRVYIADILQVFHNLTDLYYITTTTFYFSSQSNESEKLTTPHQHLINLQLRGYDIDEEQTELIAVNCPQLRRLFMTQCNYSALDTITRLQRSSVLQNLEILMFNSIDAYHPPLPLLPPTAATIEGTEEKKDKNKKGIRTIYINTGGSPTPANHILPLIYNNRYTLETIVGCFERSMDTSDAQQVFQKYPDFKLPSLRHLTFWLNGGLKNVLLQAVRKSPSLKWLEIMDSGGFVDQTLNILLEMPSLDHLSFQVSNAILEDSEQLLLLFKKYAQLSENEGCSLKSISFQESSRVMTDPILKALSNIQSLEEMWINGYFPNTSIEQMHQMITKLGNQRLKGICLHAIEESTTSTIVCDVLSGIVNKLSWIQLRRLSLLRDRDVRTLVDKIEPNSSLNLLIIENCRLVTRESINYARKKIKTVICDRPCSPYILSAFNSNYHIYPDYLNNK
ncbi:hypothetical protein BDA99DRAFT_502800 [Phascolomyces articulosus]|uniref:F-box domain-containing protein n=1 Tax=Phascolomyces articulosus TaxID=60185 RepID=A0AAD5PG69_9FUNG|nr:hypothetical protein BDA99DRAFT_502800 [Phascolomyces articulosus]